MKRQFHVGEEKQRNDPQFSPEGHWLPAETEGMKLISTTDREDNTMPTHKTTAAKPQLLSFLCSLV
jgi:hypothetical protein